MEAILAQMRAAQGIEAQSSSEDEDARDGPSASATTRATPAEEAARFKAMQNVCAAFARETKSYLGSRWYGHFESWLYSRRAAARRERTATATTMAKDDDGDEAFPRGEKAMFDKALARKLKAAGATDGEAKFICKTVGKASESEWSKSVNARGIGKNYVRAREFDVNEDVRKVELVCGKIKVEVNARHYDKLRRMYDRTNGSRTSDDDFNRAAFCVVARYATLQGTHYKAGNMQAAIPPKVFEVLQKKFDVSCEMFASPLNASLNEFCSACPSTDAVFGSRGSAFSFEPEEGSYECNPPFDEGVIRRLVGHLEGLLSSAGQKRPLSFCVVVPTWTESAAWMRLANSEYCASNTTLNAKEHAFVSGAQHSRIDQITPSSAPTSVMFLQNAAAKRKWPVTEDGIQAIRRAFAPPAKLSTEDKLPEWDPETPLPSRRSSRRLPPDAKSWVYASATTSNGEKRSATDVSAVEKKKKKTQKTIETVGKYSASFFREQ